MAGVEKLKQILFMCKRAAIRPGYRHLPSKPVRSLDLPDVVIKFLPRGVVPVSTVDVEVVLQVVDTNSLPSGRSASTYNRRLDRFKTRDVDTPVVNQD
jgi:hypothetical protein